MSNHFRLAFPAALLLAALAHAQDGDAPAAAKTLTVGSPAPTPDVETFVRGQQPEWFLKDKTYVIEFWATWCGPCRTSMPHLSDLAEKYKDKGVIVVGISDEQVETVKNFLDKPEWQQKARYILGTDPDRSVHEAYMKAAGQNGIPTAFIVKDDTVQWIGHPMTMDEPLAKVVAGTWKPDEYKKSFEAEQAMAKKQMQRRAAMVAATKSKDWDAIVKMYDEDIAAADGAAKDALRVQKMQFLLANAKRNDDGYKLGREIVAANIGNAMVLNQVAWFILDTPKLEGRDLDFALGTAKAAVEASKGEDGSILDTLARAYWEKGDKANAVTTQKQAIQKAGEGQADELRATLEKYEKGTAPAQETKKTSWVQDAPAAAPAAPQSPKAPAAPAAPKAPGDDSRPMVDASGAKLNATAEAAFPDVTSEGFDSLDAAVAYMPKLSTDPDATQRVMKAMAATTPEGKAPLRVVRGMFADMQPMIAATVSTFKRPFGGFIQLPQGMEGVTFAATDVTDTTALIGATGKDGKPVGRPVPMVKVDGKWCIDFTKASGNDAAARQTIMMANALGPVMRDAFRNAANQVSDDITAGKVKSQQDAQMAFNATMQMELAKAMGMGGGPGGPGGPAGPGPGAGAPPRGAPNGK